MSDDGRPWWYAPRQARALSAPVAAVLLAMGVSDLLRAGPAFWLGWLLLVVGAGLGVVVVAGQRHDDREAGRSWRRSVPLVAGLLGVVVVAVLLNLTLARELGP